jgi:hypothetical protein
MFNEYLNNIIAEYFIKIDSDLKEDKMMKKQKPTNPEFLISGGDELWVWNIIKKELSVLFFVLCFYYNGLYVF